MGRIDGAPLLESIGASVAKRRMELDLSQEDLAERAGVHRTYISDIERGVRNVSVLTLARIAVALDVPLGVLFFTTVPLNVMPERVGIKRRQQSAD